MADIIDRGVTVAVGVHIDLDVRRAGSIVETGDRAVPVQQRGNLVNIGPDTRDVGRRRERTDAQAALVLGRLQQLFQVREIDIAGKGE